MYTRIEYTHYCDEVSVTYRGRNHAPLLESQRPGTSSGTRLSLEEDVGKQYSVCTLNQNAEKKNLWIAPLVKPQRALDFESEVSVSCSSGHRAGLVLEYL